MIWKALRLTVQPVLVLLMTVVIVEGQTQKSATTVTNSLSGPATAQPALMTDYKGVRIGMTTEEAYAKLGRGTRLEDQEFYVFNDRETALVVFDANKVVIISVDYLGGVGAPDYRTVVGPDIAIKPDGSMYKIVHYDELGFWVSYNRSANNTVVMVSITIQRTLK